MIISSTKQQQKEETSTNFYSRLKEVKTHNHNFFLESTFKTTEIYKTSTIFYSSPNVSDLRSLTSQGTAIDLENKSCLGGLLVFFVKTFNLGNILKDPPMVSKGKVKNRFVCVRINSTICHNG